MDSHHVGRQEVNRLSQHCGFGFDPTDAPADDSQTIDHRRVRISPHQTVRVIETMLFPDALAQEFEIDLMTDAYPGRNHSKAIERLHAPLQKLITRVVAAKLHLHILDEDVAGAGKSHLHRMIDYQIDGH